MVRKLMLAGLMTATMLGSIAPAYAQSNENNRGNRGDRGAQQRGNDAPAPGRMTGERGAAWRERQAQQVPVQQRQAERQVQAAPAQRQWQQRPQTPVVDAQVNRQDRRDDRRDVRQDVRQDRRGDRQDWRQDRREDQRVDRRDVRQDRQQDRREDQRVDRRDVRQDRQQDRRDDRRDYRTDNGRRDNNWSNGRRYDDRTRWATQQRWNNGWRQDRRYDWQSNRARYGDRYRAGRYYAPRGWDYGYRRFSVGIVLSSLLYSNNYWLDDPYSYRLPPAYGSLRWVRYYDDAMLVDTRDGYVVDVIHDFFW